MKDINEFNEFFNERKRYERKIMKTIIRDY